MKLLITGVPGMGKTTVGDYFRDRLGYKHLDMEGVPRGSVEEFLNCVNAFLGIPGNDKVITWGFMPGQDDWLVRDFQNKGYRMIWFDGNRAAARRAFIKRGTVSEADLDLQMARIDKMDLSIFAPITMDTFDDNGQHLGLDVIAQGILRECASTGT